VYGFGELVLLTGTLHTGFMVSVFLGNGVFATSETGGSLSLNPLA